MIRDLPPESEWFRPPNFILVRDRDTGAISIQAVNDPMMDPRYTAKENFYTRPGRFIPINGDPSRMTASEIVAAERKADGDNQVGPGSGT